jgi:hypothetical protein
MTWPRANAVRLIAKLSVPRTRQQLDATAIRRDLRCRGKLTPPGDFGFHTNLFFVDRTSLDHARCPVVAPTARTGNCCAIDCTRTQTPNGVAVASRTGDGKTFTRTMASKTFRHQPECCGTQRQMPMPIHTIVMVMAAVAGP